MNDDKLNEDCDKFDIYSVDVDSFCLTDDIDNYDLFAEKTEDDEPEESNILFE